MSWLHRWQAWRERQAILNAPPRLVATYRRQIRWTDHNNLIEDIDFRLLQDGRGRRSYRVHEYGYCAIYKCHREYLGPVLSWVEGGPLPEWAEPVYPDAPRLRVVK